MTKKNIIKYSKYHDFLEPVKQAKLFVPKWYKDIKNYNYNNIEWGQDGHVKTNVKNCVPFLDSLTSGYTIELSSDIYVEKIDNEPVIRWGSNFKVVDVREPEHSPIPTPLGCHTENFIWIMPYTFRIPKGTSMLVTHPINRFDLPFVSLSGIIDGGNIISTGNFPFYLKKDFEGVIKAGTPILQIIPFTPGSWKIQEDESLRRENDKKLKGSEQVFFNYYRNKIWQKKSYE